jgi:glycine cleavage system H protein
MYPKDRRYTKEHEWVLKEDAAATMGITDYAQDQLGDIVYVEVPEVGKQVSKGDVIGSIESVKAVSEIYAPVSGTIMAVNEELDGTPEVVNSDPHGKGWYCKMELSDAGELEGLMDSEAYGQFVESSS